MASCFGIATGSLSRTVRRGSGGDRTASQMNIYLFGLGNTGHQSLTGVTDKDDERIFKVFSRGRRVGKSWRPLAVRTEKDTAHLPRGDFASLSLRVPVVSPHAWGVLRPLLRDSVEALPLKHEAADYIALNVVRTIDCLDLLKSEVSIISDHVNWVHKWVFRNLDRVEGQPIFKTPETKALVVLVSDEFKRVAEAAKLTGLVLKKIY